MFKSTITNANLESIIKELGANLGADSLEFVQLAHTKPEKEFALHLSYKFTEDYHPSNADMAASTILFLDKFLAHLADRISYGEIKTLRERCKQYEWQLGQLRESNEEQIKDLMRYKHAYELANK